MAEDISQPAPSAPVASAQDDHATPPVAASSAADQSTPPNTTPPVAAPEDATKPGGGADVAAYKKEFDDYLSGRLEKPPPAPAAPQEPEAPAPASIAPPPEPAPAAPTEDVAPPEDEPLPTDGSLPKNIKLKVQSAFDFELMTLRKRGYDWADAQDMAAKRYPESPEAKALAARTTARPAPTTDTDLDATAPPATPSTPATLEALDATIAEVETRLDEAVLNYDRDAMREARAELRKLNAQRPLLLEAERQSATTVQEQFNAEFNDYLSQAETLYPAAKDPQSPLSQRAAAIQAQLRKKNPALYHAPESALLVFQRAAKELGVKPTVAPPPATPPAAPPSVSHQAATPAPQPPAHRRPPGAALIAGGNARTTQPGPAPETDFSKMTRRQYDAYMEKYLQTSAA